MAWATGDGESAAGEDRCAADTGKAGCRKDQSVPACRQLWRCRQDPPGGQQDESCCLQIPHWNAASPVCKSFPQAADLGIAADSAAEIWHAFSHKSSANGAVVSTVVSDVASVISASHVQQRAQHAENLCILHSCYGRSGAWLKYVTKLTTRHFESET